MRGAKPKEMFVISDLRREILHLGSVCLFFPEGGRVLLYFHTYVGLGYFLGFKILNFNIFGGFQKTDFWGVIIKLVYTMHFRVFSEGQGTEWRIFLGC